MVELVDRRSPGAFASSYYWLADVLAQTGIDNNNKGMTNGHGGRSSRCGCSQVFPSLGR